MAVDVAQMKMAEPRGDICDRYVSHTCICARVCAHVWLRITHPVKDFCFLLICVLLIYTRIHLDFCHVGLCFRFNMLK